MMGPFVLAVDIGTGSVRGSLFDGSGDIHFTARTAYPTRHPRPGWSEQDADVVLAATVESIRSAMDWAEGRSHVVALSFSSQMYSIMALGRDGMPQSPVLPWLDTRAEEYAARQRTEPILRDLAQTTGCPPQPIYPLAKIGWLKDNLDLGNETTFVSVKDYVVGRLVGDITADWSTASSTGLFDVSRLDWFDDALALCGLGRENLPPLGSPRQVLTVRSDSILGEMRRDLRVVLGAGDAPLSTIGSGAISPETFTINIGTSGAVRQLIDKPVVDVEGRLWTYVVDEGHWVTGGIVGSAGSALDWLLGVLSTGGSGLDQATYHHTMKLVEEVSPGSEDLTFLPYLVGEQSPDWRCDARGAYVGLTLRHDRSHMMRAVLEGIAFALRRVHAAIEDGVGTSASQVTLTGSLGSSTVVRQIIADVFGLPVALAVPEGSSRGAAILGWIALGRFESYEDFFRGHIEVSPRTSPDTARSTLYDARYEEFVGITRRLWSGH